MENVILCYLLNFKEMDFTLNGKDCKGEGTAFDLKVKIKELTEDFIHNGQYKMACICINWELETNQRYRISIEIGGDEEYYQYFCKNKWKAEDIPTNCRIKKDGLILVISKCR